MRACVFVWQKLHMVRITEKRPSGTQLPAGSTPVGSKVMSWTDLQRRTFGERVTRWCSDSDNRKHLYFVTIITLGCFVFHVSSVHLTTVRSEIWPPGKNESWQFKFWNFWISLEVKYSFYLWHICSWADKVNLWLTIQTNSKTKTGSTSEYFWEGKN